MDGGCNEVQDPVEISEYSIEIMADILVAHMSHVLSLRDDVDVVPV